MTKRKRGKWKQGYCSECGYDWDKDAPIASVPNFCPNCGAQMDEKKGEKMVELKPCPFCGGKARLVILEHENSDTTRWHKIMCEDVFGCGAEIGTALSAWQADYKEAVQRLAGRWNRRYEPSE